MQPCQELHEEIIYDGIGQCPLCAEIEAHAACRETSEQQCARIQELLDERDGYRSELRL